MELAGTVVRAEHGVEPDQYEPGFPESQQAQVHAQEYLMADASVHAALGLRSWLAAEARVPVRLVRQTVEFRRAGGAVLPDFSSIHHRDETQVGLGDVSIVGRFHFAPASAWGVDLRAGLNLPTGGTEPDPFALGRAGKPHRHLFFGSGTFDPIVGGRVTYALGTVRLSAWATVRAPLYENSFGYRASTQTSAGLGVESSFGLRSWRFVVQPEVFHESTASWTSEEASNSGRIDLVGTLGAFWNVSEAWTARLLVKVPWTLAVVGGQLSIPAVGVLGVERAIDLGGS